MSTSTINPQDLQSESKETGSLTIPMILAGVVLLAYLPMLIEHFQLLWRLEQYQYFPFVIGAVAWLGWTRWQEATLVEDQTLSAKGKFWHNVLPVVATVLAMLCLGVAIYSKWGWFAALSLNLLTGAGLLVLTKHFHIRNAWGIWALMWLMLPPPIEFGAFIVQKMQLISSIMSSQILDLMKIDHLMTGNVFTLPSKQLFVDEACSGIVSVMSVIAATGMYAVWKDRSLLHALLLMLASVGWALVMNTVRIVVIAIAESWFGINLADGSAHEVLGLVLFSVTFIAAMSTDQFLEFALGPIKAKPGESGVRGNPIVQFWNWMGAALVPKFRKRNADQSTLNGKLSGILTPKLVMTGVPIALAGIWAVLVYTGVVGARPAPTVNAEALLTSISAETLPAEIHGWKQAEYEGSDREDGAIQGHWDFGRFSNSYTYVNGVRKSQVSMDYPFTGGWHELSACYRMTGWKILERQTGSENGREYVETTFKMPDREQYAHLVFNNFNEQGEVITPPSGAILRHTWFFIRRRFLRKIASDLYQVQAFTVSNAPLTEEQKQNARALFFEAEKKLTGYTAGQAGQL